MTCTPLQSLPWLEMSPFSSITRWCSLEISISCGNLPANHVWWHQRVTPKKDVEKCETRMVWFSVTPNNVLLVKIEGPVWYTIYHHLSSNKPVVQGVNLQSPLFSSTKQWEFGTSMVIRCNKYIFPYFRDIPRYLGHLWPLASFPLGDKFQVSMATATRPPGPLKRTVPSWDPEK